MAHVAAALSGGVDSAVTAHLLLRRGHTVTGVHMVIGSFEAAGHGPPPRVRAVARALGIPLEVLDLSEEFRREVVDYFVHTYGQGRTPNPCVVCNPRIKFGVLWEKVRHLGAELLATGHYARILWDETGRYPLLFKGVDPDKDQSYFLHRLDRDQLARTLFPLGGLRKEEVRTRAAELGLAELVAPESQEFCFMGAGDYKELIESAVQSLPGDLVDTRGRVLGRHQGIHRYTVGQRRGLNLPSTEPYYVVRIEPASRRVVVGRREDLFSRGLVVREINWIIEPPGGVRRVLTRVRFRHREAESVVEPLDASSARVIFDRVVRAATPGQAAVFYDGPQVLGGGWIAETFPDI